MEKLKMYLEEAAIVPRERVPMDKRKTPAWATEKRIKEKKRRSEVLKNRQERRSKGRNYL